jgi:hypothetical protein
VNLTSAKFSGRCFRLSTRPYRLTMYTPGLLFGDRLKLPNSWGRPSEHPFVTPFLSTKIPGKGIRFVSDALGPQRRYRVTKWPRHMTDTRNLKPSESQRTRCADNSQNTHMSRCTIIQAIETMNRSEQCAVEQSTGYSWIAGEMLGIKHIELIEAGGSGEVHKVLHFELTR